MSARQASVAVVDDDPGVCQAIVRILKLSGLNAQSYTSGRQYLDQYDRDVPGCLLLDLAMPDIGGLELQHAIAEQGVGLPIIFLTGCASVPESVCALKRGAFDFLTKPVDDTILLQSVRSAIELDCRQRAERAEVAALLQRFTRLTPREEEVLKYVAAGWLNKQIAVELGTVEKTVKVHRARVMEKLEADSVAELVLLTTRAGFAIGPWYRSSVH